MNTPKFTAESSLSPTLGIYPGMAAVSEYSKKQITMQLLSETFFPSPLISALPFIRCCQYASAYGRVVCTKRYASPLENCSCKYDYNYGPLITCRPPVVLE